MEVLMIINSMFIIFLCLYTLYHLSQVKKIIDDMDVNLKRMTIKKYK